MYLNQPGTPQEQVRLRSERHGNQDEVCTWLTPWASNTVQVTPRKLGWTDLNTAAGEAGAMQEGESELKALEYCSHLFTL